MQACGIIAEYNPFHLGHAYQLELARKKTDADCLIAVMSGNWMQRGEPALFDKWTRARSALLNGCDLVIELPPHYAVQSADFFARGAVKLLNALHINSLCFGTDVEVPFDYQTFGQNLVSHEAEINTELLKLQHSGLNYVNRMRAVYAELGLVGAFSSATPNHLLALSYAKEVARQNPAIALVPIMRRGAGFHDGVEASQKFASASGLRDLILAGDFAQAEPFMPENNFAQMQQATPHSWDNYFDLLRYQLTLQTPTQLQSIYQMTEGLENLLKAQLPAENFATYLDALKTKRYSFGRLSRLLSYVLLGITQDELMAQNDYLRILGFTENGQRYLNQIKKDVELPLIAKPTKQQHDLLALNKRVDAIYQLSSPFKDLVRDHPPWRV